MSRYSIQEIEQFTNRFYQGRPLLLVPFGYGATFAALAPAAQQTQVIAIAANADFMMLGIRHRANIAAAQVVSTKTSPFARLLITDTGSNEQYTNGAVDLENYSQNDGKDVELSYPRIIGGRSSLNLTLTSYAPIAETYSIDVFLDGLLIRAYNAA